MIHKPFIVAFALVINSCHASPLKIVQPPEAPPSHMEASNPHEKDPSEDDTLGGEARRNCQPLPISFE